MTGAEAKALLIAGARGEVRLTKEHWAFGTWVQTSTVGTGVRFELHGIGEALPIDEYIFGTAGTWGYYDPNGDRDE